MKKKTKAAGNFTLDEALDMFDLKYKDFDREAFYRWNIQNSKSRNVSVGLLQDQDLLIFEINKIRMQLCRPFHRSIFQTRQPFD